jgi:hypothetical protein
MSALLIAAVIFTANQGSVVQLAFPHEAGMRSVEVVWEGKKVPAFHVMDT